MLPAAEQTLLNPTTSWNFVAVSGSPASLPRAKLGGMRKHKVKGAGRSMQPVSHVATTPCAAIKSLAGLPEWARPGCSIESHAQSIPSSLLVPQLPSNGGGPGGSLLTVADAAARLNVSTKTIRRLIQRGELRAVRIGRAIRIQPEDIERLIKR